MSNQLIYQEPELADDFRFFLRYEQSNAKTEYLPHVHTWGQAIFVKCNVLEMNVEGKRLLTPTNMPIWIPPGKEHASYNLRQAWFRTFNIAGRLCGSLPAKPCLLKSGPIANAIMDECAERQLAIPVTEQDKRLCEVLFDELHKAEVQDSYLPYSQDKYLAPILQALEQNPADNTTLAQWAQRVYTTERTLARRCRMLLGLSFSEWRQRLRFLHAISLLEQGKTVQEVALDLGYSSSSALVVMFRQQSGTTPERYRSRGG